MSDELFSEHITDSVYRALRELARQKLIRERSDHTLQPTALVHEVYCRLHSRIASKQQWNGRDHFMAAAAEAMRRTLVEHARRKLSLKRGGEYRRMPVDDIAAQLPLAAEDLLAIHEALKQLAHEEAIAAELVKLRYFAGFSHLEAAEHLQLSKSKADRVWAYARARLFVLIAGQRKAGTPPKRSTT